MPSRVASGFPPSESTWTVAGSDRRLGGSTSRFGEAGRGHATVLGMGDEVGAGEPPHPGEHAGRVGERRIAQRVDDAVEPVDDLPLAPPGRERRRRDRDRRHRHGLDGDQRDQDLVADRPPHRIDRPVARTLACILIVPPSIRPSRRPTPQGLVASSAASRNAVVKSSPRMDKESPAVERRPGGQTPQRVNAQRLVSMNCIGAMFARCWRSRNWAEPRILRGSERCDGWSNCDGVGLPVSP